MSVKLLSLTVRGAVVALAAAHALAALAADAPAPAYAPAKTVVAVLPGQNVGGGKDAAQKQRDADDAAKAAAAEVAARGFTVEDPAAVADAVKTAGVDLSKSDNWAPANLAKVGQAAHADLVLQVGITKTHRGITSNVLGAARRDGEAYVTVWLVDVRQGAAILPGVSAHAKVKANAGHSFVFGVFDNADPYVRRAIRQAVADALSGFLKLYPTPDPKAIKYE